MKQGRTIVELANEVQRQAALKADYKVPTTQLSLHNGTDLVVGGKVGKVFTCSEHTHKQLGARLKISAQYYDMLRKEQPDMLDYNVTELLHRKKETRLVRTLESGARAFLSDRYARRDDIDLMRSILPDLMEAGEKYNLQIASCEITWRKLYIKYVTPRLEGEVKKGDPVQAGGIISNSEIGEGYTEVYPFIKRLICDNGAAVTEYGQRKAHITKRIEMEEEEAMELYSDETIAADDQAFWMKVRDSVRLTLKPENFEKLLGKLRQSADAKIDGSVPDVIEMLANKYALDQSEQASVLTNLLEGGIGLTQWGLANAVTSLANTTDDYDRATELERMGGKIITLAPTEWKALN